MNSTLPRTCALALLAGSVAVSAGCKSTGVADLADNSRLYQDTGYTCKQPGDRSVFVAPLADAREPVVESAAQQNGFPISYDGDERWDRPVVEMLDEVLHREIADSNLFARIDATAAAADVVIVPSLVTFATAGIEEASGGRGLAEVGVRVQVFGPLPPAGERALLLDQVYGDRRVTDVAFRTPSRHLLAGIVARSAIVRLLQGLDSKNVGRNGMPTVIDTPATAPGITPSAAPVAPAGPGNGSAPTTGSLWPAPPGACRATQFGGSPTTSREAANTAPRIEASCSRE